MNGTCMAIVLFIYFLVQYWITGVCMPLLRAIFDSRGPYSVEK